MDTTIKKKLNNFSFKLYEIVFKNYLIINTQIYNNL